MSINTMVEGETSTPSLTSLVSTTQTTPAIGSKREPVFEIQKTVVQPAISIERATQDRLPQLESAWRDLVTRACEPNAFMHPAVIQARRGEGTTLLAWQAGQDGAKLMGIWAFSSRGVWRPAMPPHVLASPAFPHAYLATPVVDRAGLETVLTGFLDFIGSAADLPKIIMLDPVTLDGLTMQALTRVIKSRRTKLYIFNRSHRPILVSDLEGKQYFEKALSGSTRKKLRQQRRRLEERGTLESKVSTSLNDVETAFEEFLALEAAGWKGRRGTALLSNQAESDSVRRMITKLARCGDVEIHALCQHGRTVASQVVLRAGSFAFTWKTAYDEGSSEFSPGMLLLENYTAALLADKSITLVDSCAFDDRSFMSAWTERQAIAQVVFDARPGVKLSASIFAFAHNVFLKLRSLAKEIYARRPV